MRGLHDRVGRRLAALLLVVVMLVPVAASAHRHDPVRSKQPCATCVVAHHSPAVGSPVLAPITPTRLVLATNVRSVTVVLTRAAQRPTGRAPPTLPTSPS